MIQSLTVNNTPAAIQVQTTTTPSTFKSIREDLKPYLINDVISIVISYAADFRCLNIHTHEDPKNAGHYKKRMFSAIISECSSLVGVLRLIRISLKQVKEKDEDVNKTIIKVIKFKVSVRKYSMQSKKGQLSDNFEMESHLQGFYRIQRDSYWKIAPYGKKLYNNFLLSQNDNKLPKAWKSITPSEVIVIKNAEVSYRIMEKLSNGIIQNTEHHKKQCQAVFKASIVRDFDNSILFLNLIDIPTSENASTFDACILNKTTAIRTMLPFCKDNYDRTMLLIEACFALAIDSSQNATFHPNTDIKDKFSYQLAEELARWDVSLNMMDHYGRSVSGIPKRYENITILSEILPQSSDGVKSK